MIPQESVPGTPTLVVFPELAEYARAVATASPRTFDRKIVPVLGAEFEPRGFPSGTAVLDPGGWPGEAKAAPPPVAGSSVVVALAEPLCAAVGRLLAVTGHRTLMTVANDAELGAAVDGWLDADDGGSIALVLPGWNGSGRPTSTWLRAALRQLRARRERLANRSIGLLTAARPTDLSALAAKSVLGAEVAAAYRESPSCLFSTFDDPAVRTAPLARWTAGAAASPLMLVDESHIADGTATDAMAQRWNALVFKSHGRPYCASRGYLCGARSLDVDPATPAEHCVLGMSCVSAAFPRLDPRRLDGSVLVLDACGAGSWASPVWEWGVPSLAFHAVAGAPSAVITGDHVTMNRSGDFADVFWALASAATMGEAVARLNWVRRCAGRPPALDYFLLGDPDLPAGPARWPAWAGPAGTSTPYTRIALADREPPFDATTEVVHLWRDEARTPLAGARVFGAWRDGEVWFVDPLPGSASAPPRVAVEPVPALPAGLADEALTFPARSRTWTTVLAAARDRLTPAADRLIAVHRVLEQTPGTVVQTAPADLRAIVDMALTEWRRAQVAAVEHALTSSARGLWPYRYWSVADVVTDDDHEPCPYCGIAPTLRRVYHSRPGLTRQQWECQRCDLIHDRAVAPDAPDVSLDVPERLPTGTAVPATLRVAAASDGADLHGAVVVTVDGTGHGVTGEPGVVEFDVPAGGRRDLVATLTVRTRPERPHLWRVRALCLLNGAWSLVSRQVRVGVD